MAPEKFNELAVPQDRGWIPVFSGTTAVEGLRIAILRGSSDGGCRVLAADTDPGSNALSDHIVEHILFPGHGPESIPSTATLLVDAVPVSDLEGFSVNEATTSLLGSHDRVEDYYAGQRAYTKKEMIGVLGLSLDHFQVQLRYNDRSATVGVEDNMLELIPLA